MCPDHLRVLYLHGFASSPASRKAVYFAAKLRALGFTVDIPDLAGQNFQQLTITGQLDVIAAVANAEPVILIGSSLGGYLASLYAANHPEVDKLILLAPAFAFSKLWTSRLSPAELTQWKEDGHIGVYHYAAGKKLPLNYELLDDAARYADFPAFSQPALLFHGVQDPSVPLQSSVDFVKLHPNASLVRLQSGHELTDVLDVIWQDSHDFLLNGPSGN